jgi:hypothetical protein
VIADDANDVNTSFAAGAGTGPAAASVPFMDVNGKILHRKILMASQTAPGLQGGLVETYRRDVCPQKTRTVRLLGVKCAAEIIQTLLGYEVQAQQKRIQCPDLVTARYLRLFSEFGCRTIRLPYDPTLTGSLIPLLEAAQKSILDTVARIFPKDRELQQYVIRKIYAILREEFRKET